MTVQTHAAPAAAATKPLFVVPFIVAIAFLMEQLDSTIITAALPAIAADFRVPTIQLNLAVSVYVLSLAAFIPASGWLADRFGARSLFSAAIGLFMAASVLSGIAVDLPLLIVGRILQGVAGAMMTPIGRLLIIRSFEKKDLAAALAYLSMPVLVGPILGPLLGGFIVTVTSWRMIFFINIPIGIVGILLTLRFVPPVPPEAPRRFDLAGFLYCTLALSALQMALEEIVHPLLPASLTPLLFGAAVVFGAIYAWHARRTLRPALELDLLAQRLFGVAFTFGGLSRMGLNAVPFILQLQLQLGFHRTPFEAGALVFLTAFGALLFKPVMRVAMGRCGFRTVLFGNAIAGGLMIAGFSLFDAATPTWLMACYIFVFGFSRSLQFNAVNALLYADVAKDRQSAGASLGGVGQQLAMGFGISVSAVAISLFEKSGIGGVMVYADAFLVMAAATLASAFGFLILKADDGSEVSRHRRGARTA